MVLSVLEDNAFLKKCQEFVLEKTKLSIMSSGMNNNDCVAHDVSDCAYSYWKKYEKFYCFAFCYFMPIFCRKNTNDGCLYSARITISCRMNFDDYPLDAHTCQFQVGSCKYYTHYTAAFYPNQ